MLDEFIQANRELIISRTRARVMKRTGASARAVELMDGVPMFLDQLGAALRHEGGGGATDHGEIRARAERHGHELLGMGLTIGQVVHDYGDVCQVITDLAMTEGRAIPADEFKTLNLCLDDAIAEAVTAYSQQRERSLEAQGIERMGMLAHELRNLLNTAALSFGSIRAGVVPIGGSTGMLLARNLEGLGQLVDRALADVRLDVGIHDLRSIEVAGLLEEIEISASMAAATRGQSLSIGSVAPKVQLQGDRQILSAAISNLLQNAFKFTPRGGRISLTTVVTADQVRFEIRDECGGLPPGAVESMFGAFDQRSGDRSGAGLGLAICGKAARAHGGTLDVKDRPGIGCIFTLEVPRQQPEPPLFRA